MNTRDEDFSNDTPHGMDKMSLKSTNESFLQTKTNQYDS